MVKNQWIFDSENAHYVAMQMVHILLCDGHNCAGKIEISRIVSEYSEQVKSSQIALSPNSIISSLLIIDTSLSVLFGSN